MDFTINLIWVVLATFTLLLTVIASIVKSSREAERFESWLKTHEKEISELKQTCQALNTENKLLRESLNLQNSNFANETRRMENMMSSLALSIGKIDTKLELLLSGRIKNHLEE
jgi:hypothetical protein